MKRNTFALLLALITALAIPVTGFSQEPDATSIGSISFSEYDDSGDGILDPGGSGVCPPVLEDDLEEFDPEDKDRLCNLETMGFDFGSHEASLFDREYESINMSGLLVRSGYDGWEVSVKVNSFYRDGNGINKTLEGAFLEFTPVFDSATQIYSGGEFRDLDTEASDSSQYNVIAKGKAGIYGINYEGLLKVKGNTAHKGEAKAVIDWVFQSAKP